MPPEVAARAVQVMKALNKEASRLMVELQTSACTDITGFGFLGHAYEMASGSGVTLVIHRNAVPIIEALWSWHRWVSYLLVLIETRIT